MTDHITSNVLYNILFSCISGNNNYSTENSFTEESGNSMLNIVEATSRNCYAVSLISTDGELYYYKRICPQQYYQNNTAFVTKLITGQDHVDEHFPVRINYDTGSNIKATFKVAFSKELKHYAICIVVQYMLNIGKKCKHNSITCQSEYEHHYLYFDEAAKKLSPFDGVSVEKKVQEHGSEKEVTLELSIKDAKEKHAGQYVCNVFTEPTNEGASIHTQTKVIFGNNTHLLPEGFNMAQINVCGKTHTTTNNRRNVTIVSNLDNCLICYTAGYPNSSIIFMKDGQELNMTSENSLDEPSGDMEFRAATFILKSPKPEDSGKYTCLSQNGESQDKSSIYITVENQKP